MSIEKRKGYYVIVCDMCGETSEEYDTWEDAKNAKKALGYKSTCYRTETEDIWQDLCSDCQD